MKISHMAILAAASLVLAACGKDPVFTSSTDNPNVAVSKMFEFEGCTVYRFKDAGNYVYYSNCPGTTQSFRTESCGKNCTEHVPVTVQTSRGDQR
jgi:hypothetical protein